ncbi:MAG: SxtJ family membrane protein [Gemmatimonadota bacterium]|nr:SxtJ family membrane protein [Gemmatimonadota bacterium]
MDQLWQKNPTPKQLRDFGLTVGGALLVIGGILVWRHPLREWHSPLWIVGGSLMLLGLTLPRLLKLPFQLWMAFAFLLSQVMTRVILTLTYLIAFTGMGLLMRLMRRDLLEQEWAPGTQESYWRDREHLAIEDRHLRPF